MNTPMRLTQERPARTFSGGLILLALVAVVLWLIIGSSVQIASGYGPSGFLIGVQIVCIFLFMTGFYSLQPNEGSAILLFGNYKGTDKTAGLRWVPFWYTRKKVSLRVRNLLSQTLKVNDKRGNPIEIAAVVVWRVTDTAKALFDVDHYETFVQIQVETSIREIASHFSYDHSEDHEPTLRADGDQVAVLLRDKLNERLMSAGLIVDEAKLSHLAYAPEIAGAMLRRQQAEAVLAARRLIVQGAVEMVEGALAQLSERKLVTLDDDRKAQMVSNLLVVLCGDRDAQPVVNTGAQA